MRTDRQTYLQYTESTVHIFCSQQNSTQNTAAASKVFERCLVRTSKVDLKEVEVEHFFPGYICLTHLCPLDFVQYLRVIKASYANVKVKAGEQTEHVKHS